MIPKTDEFAALVDIKAGDLLNFDYEAKTARHATDWNYMGMACRDCKAGEKVLAIIRGSAQIEVRVSGLYEQPQPIPIERIIAAVENSERDYAHFDQDDFDE